MEFNYKILTINVKDRSTHVIAAGLAEKDALKMFRNLVLCQDPNEDVMFAIDKYIPVKTIQFKS